MSTGALDDHGPQADPLEFLGSQVEEIMSAARKAAAQLQAEVQRSATERSAQIETAAARRAHAVRMAAEAEAERLHAHALVATRQYVTASRRLVDEFARERMRRIADVGDGLAEQAETLVRRLMRADDVARQLDELRAALGAASERIAAEAQRDGPETPQFAQPASTAPGATAGGAWAAPPGAELPSTAPGATAGGARAAAPGAELPSTAPAAAADARWVPAQDVGPARAQSQEARLARATGRPAKRVGQAGRPTPIGFEEVADDA
jgi:DNA-binding TFAR19-related protein (PDSD5 family)